MENFNTEAAEDCLSYDFKLMDTDSGQKNNGASPEYRYLGNPFDDAMDDVYISCNAANILFYLAAPLTFPIIILGTAWNLVDSSGAFILAYQEGRNHNQWVQGINVLSGIQLLAGTIASLLLNPDIVYLGIHASLGLSIIAASLSSFAFAAAMFFSLALEHHKVKICRAEIDKLEISIKEALSNPDNMKADKLKDIKDEREKKIFLETLLENLRGNNLTGNEELLDHLENWHYQQQKLEIHERARRVWGFCAVFMTVVAIVSVAVTALGLSASTCGITVAIASALAVGSGLYRLCPEFFDNKFKTIKNNVHSFFKPKPIRQDQVDNLDSSLNTSPFAPAAG